MRNNAKAKFVYKSRIQSEDRYTRENISLKKMYEIGLFVGSTLKGSIYDKRIIKALRSGNPVYFMARDMTPFWEFLKDQYSNLYPIYNVNRKVLKESQQINIKNQVQLNKKGLVVDTGFSGSCVTPLIEMSKTTFNKGTGKRERVLKGLLLSGSARVVNGGNFDCVRTERESKTYRNVVIDLEHSPKREFTNDESTYSSLRTDKQFIAFRLGFFSGLMNLNKSMNKKIISIDLAKKKLYERIEQSRQINQGVRKALNKLDLIARYGMCYYLVDQYDNNLGRWIYEVKQGVNHRSYVDETIYISGLGSVKGTYKERGNALKACEIVNAYKKKVYEGSNWNNYVQKEQNLKSRMQLIERYEQTLISAQEDLARLLALKESFNV